MSPSARIEQIIRTVEVLGPRIATYLKTTAPSHGDGDAIYGALLDVASYLTRLKNDNPELFDEALRERLEAIKEPLTKLGNWGRPFTVDELLSHAEEHVEKLKQAVK